MVTASKINEMIKKHMGTDAFKAEYASQALVSQGIKEKTKDNYEEAIKILKECICNFAPPSLAENMPAMLDGSINRDFTYSDGSFDVSVDFSPTERVRISLDYNNRDDYVYDILGLFTQGYQINPTEDNHKRVFGYWHGFYTVNRLYRDPNDFIWKAIQFFQANYADEYGVEFVLVQNSLYL